MSNFDITELLTDRRTDERTDEWKSGHLRRSQEGREMFHIGFDGCLVL